MSEYLIISALHGNEDFSVGVMEEVMKKYPGNEYGYDWMIGNPKALKRGTRFVDTDLNRCAPGNFQSELYEERRAAELVEMSGGYDFVIDIHGTESNCGVTTLIPMPSLRNLVLAKMIGCRRNIIWNAPESQNKGPVTQFTRCPAVEIECGPKNTEPIKRALSERLSDFVVGYRNGTLLRNSMQEENEWYRVVGPNTTNRLLDDFTPVEVEGREVIPYLSNAYGDGRFMELERLDFKNLFFTDRAFNT